MFINSKIKENYTAVLIPREKPVDKLTIYLYFEDENIAIIYFDDDNGLITSIELSEDYEDMAILKLNEFLNHYKEFEKWINEVC